MNSVTERVIKSRLKKKELGYHLLQISLKKEAFEKLERISSYSAKTKSEIVENLIVFRLIEAKKETYKFIENYETASQFKQLKRIELALGNPKIKAFCEMSKSQKRYLKKKKKQTMKKNIKDKIKIDDNLLDELEKDLFLTPLL